MTEDEMTQQEAHVEASRRIDAALAERGIVLDLGDLPLAEVPAGIVRLADTLEVLSFSYARPLTDGEHLDWEFQYVRGGSSALEESSLNRLSSLSQLRALHLGACSTGTVLDWLSPMQSLRFLAVSTDGATELGPLSRLTMLEALEISGVATDDLTALSHLTNLRSLSISGDGIRSIDAIAGLTQLEDLSIDGGDVSDYRPLSRLSRLRSLRLRSDRHEDLGPLSSLTNLELLYVTDGFVSDLRPLANVKQLRELSFAWCTHLSDLRPLAVLDRLEELTFHECDKITDLRPLARVAELRELDFSDCFDLADVTPLSSLIKLERLGLGNTKVSDTSSLDGLPNLQITYGEEEGDVVEDE